MQNLSGDQIACFLQMTNQIKATPNQESILSFKKQVQKFIEKLKKQEPIKQYYSQLTQLIQSAIVNNSNHTIEIQSKLITILILVLEQPQQYVCESDQLVMEIIDYLRFAFRFPNKNEYYTHCIANLISTIYFNKSIYQLQLMEISTLDMNLTQSKLQMRPSLFSDKSLQMVLREKAHELQEIQQELLNFHLPEFQLLALELSSVYMTCPQIQVDLDQCPLYANQCIKLLQAEEQLKLYMKSDVFDNEILDQIHQLVFHNQQLDLKAYASQFMCHLVQANNINFEKGVSVLKRMANNIKVSISYDKFKSCLLETQEVDKQVLIIDLIKNLGNNVDEIVKYELTQKCHHKNIINLLIQIISPNSIPELYKQLINKTIGSTQLLLLHILILVNEIQLDTSKLQLQCEQFELSEMYLVQLFSFYSIFNQQQYKRKVKQLNALQLIVAEGRVTYQDICSILGLPTNIKNYVSQNLALILNQQWNNISNYLLSISNQNNNQTLLQGFYQIVMFFTDPKDSEFLVLFETVHTAMCLRNKAMNLNMLLTSLKQYKPKIIQSELYLYIMLLKFNYILSENQTTQKLNETLSELSSEFGGTECNDEKELQWKKEVQTEGVVVMKHIEQRIKLLEMQLISKIITHDQHLMHQISVAIEIYRLAKISESDIKVTHSLINNSQFEYLLEDPKLQEGQNICNALKSSSLVPLATSVIQIFKNENELKILKMLAVELNKICQYNYSGRVWQNYDLHYIIYGKQQAFQQTESLSYSVKKYQLMLSFNDDYEFLKLGLAQAEHSKLEMLALLIAISKQCGIINKLTHDFGTPNDMCINQLLVRISHAGLLKLILILIKPLNLQKQKKSKKKIEIEKQLKDYLLEDPQLAINIILGDIQKSLAKNQDLREEFLYLAELVYQSDDCSQYEQIIELFDTIPIQLVHLCLRTIETNQSVVVVDAKLRHIQILMGHINKDNLDDQFYQLAYSKIIECSHISQEIINFTFQLINLIKMKENEQQSVNSGKIDVGALKEILVCEPFQSTGCTQQCMQQHFFVCKNCPLFNKTLEVCMSCAFSCHKQHQIEYDAFANGFCDCGENQKKCTQIKKVKPIISSNRLRAAPSIFEIISEKEEFRGELRDFRKSMMELQLLRDEKNSLYWPDEISDKDIVESLSSQMSMDESQELGEQENSEPSSNQNQNIIQQNSGQKSGWSKSISGESAMFKRLGVDLVGLHDKLEQQCQYAMQNCSGKQQGPVLEQNQRQEFELSNIQVIGWSMDSILMSKVQIKNEQIDIITDLRRHQDHIQHRQQIMQLPFQIRRMIDESDGLIAIGNSQQEIRMYSKNKLQEMFMSQHGHQIGRMNQSAPAPGYVKINSKYPLTSVQFNPFNSKQLLVSGLVDIHLLELKKDGLASSEKSILSRSPQIVSKVQWVSANQISWLAWNQICVLNTALGKDSYYVNEDKIKDYCIIQDWVLAFDFQGDIFAMKVQESGKHHLVQNVVIPDELKGKNKTSFCISVINGSNILLISYKNGSTFLCVFNNGSINNILKLDETLQEMKVDSLLCSPQLVSQSKQSILFTALAFKHHQTSQQLCFHKGKLISFELSNKGQVKIQVLSETLVDSYVIIKDNDTTSLIMSLQENKALVLSQISHKQQSNALIQLSEIKTIDNTDALLQQIKEGLNISILQQAAHTLPILHQFCLPPSVLATPQQIQIGPTSITVTQGFAITGIIFVKCTNDEIEVFKSRVVNKRENCANINVPFNYLEQIFTLLHHTVEYTPIQCTQVQIYIQKITLSKQMLLKLQGILYSDNREYKGYVYQDVKQRIHRLNNNLTENQVVLVNSLDALGITLQAEKSQCVKCKLVPQLIELVKSNCKLVSYSARKLLKTILQQQSNKPILGDELHYKTIMDKNFIENLKLQEHISNDQIISKLLKIQQKRLPQLFYIYNTNRNLIFDILTDGCNFNEYIDIFMSYLQFLLNCQISVKPAIQQLESIKQSWNLNQQKRFNCSVRKCLLNKQKSINIQTYITMEYAWNVFQVEAIEEEVLQQQPLSIEDKQMLMEEDESGDYLDFALPGYLDSIDNMYAPQLLLPFPQIPQPIRSGRQKPEPPKKQVQAQQVQQEQPNKMQHTNQIKYQQFELISLFINWYTLNLQEYNKRGSSIRDVQAVIIQAYNLIVLTKLFIRTSQGNSTNNNLVGQLLQIVCLPTHNISQLSSNHKQTICLLLNVLNHTKTTDSIWTVIKNVEQQQFNLDILMKALENILKSLEDKVPSPLFPKAGQKNNTEHEISSLRHKNGISEKVRQLIREITKYDNEQAINSIVKLLEKQDEILFVELLKYLLNLISLSPIIKEKFVTNKSKWARFICQASLNPQTKELASSCLKSLLQQAVQSDEYHQVKDYNLYTSQFEKIQAQSNKYANLQQMDKSLDLMLKSALKRPQIWKQFCSEMNVFDLLKKAAQTVPRQSLQLIELVIADKQL